MNTLILQPFFIFFLLLIILYAIIFSRRGEVQRAKVSFSGFDWITIVAVILGSIVMAEANNALGINIPTLWWVAVLVLITIFLLIVVMRRVKVGKPVVQRIVDERVNLIYAKSARNALFATYLTFFVHLLITNANTLDTMWLAITLAGGLLVLIASTFFYYYRKS